jgi:excisionase family DNA binding protein
MNAARTKSEELPEHLRELATTLPLTLSLQDAARVLCMHPRSLQRLVAAGELRAMRSKLSGASRVIIPRSELIRWFVEHAAR